MLEKDLKGIIAEAIELVGEQPDDGSQGFGAPLRVGIDKLITERDLFRDACQERNDRIDALSARVEELENDLSRLRASEPWRIANMLADKACPLAVIRRENAGATPLVAAEAIQRTVQA